VAAVVAAREGELRSREREAIATPGLGGRSGPHRTPRRTFGL
jgi:hypothetical protein